MPLQQCGKNGWKWGDSGACYTGPEGKKNAIKQGMAIEGPKKAGDMLAKNNYISQFELGIALAEYRAGYHIPVYADKAIAYISQEERDKVHSDDFAGPHRSFPIRDQHDVESAAKLIGHASPEDRETIKSKIKSIARRKGLKIPASWEDNASMP